MEPETGSTSPLSITEAAQLDEAPLPPLARHRLRLLAHSLRTLQSIAGRRQGPAPSPEAIVAWARTQEPLADDPGFRAAFCQQLLTSALLLAEIAAEAAPGPGGLGANDPSPEVPIESPTTGALGLELHQLVAWCEERRDDPPGQAA